jgi:predicted nucleotidyltransferase component of viral defense system
MKHTAASIRARLLNLAHANNEAFGLVLERFALGRLIYRLSKSSYAKRFVLKGAQLFSIWSDESSRPTRDVDFLGVGEFDDKELEIIFGDVCSIKLDRDDGLVWSEVSAQAIREDNRYGGIRVRLTAVLAEARIRVQVDVGFGDVITPEPVEIKWLGMLNFESCRLMGYPPETVIAEKVEAAVSLGDANSRMKDFYDLYWMIKHMNFDRGILVDAIQSTFMRRKTELPRKTPASFSDVFAKRPDKQNQWMAFLRKSHPNPIPFPEVIREISLFLSPLFRDDSPSQIKQTWKPNEGWTNLSNKSF